MHELEGTTVWTAHCNLNWQSIIPFVTSVVITLWHRALFHAKGQNKTEQECGVGSRYYIQVHYDQVVVEKCLP